MRQLWEFYYEESITRNVLKKNKIQKELISSSKFENLVEEQKKEYQVFRKEAEDNLNEFFSSKKESQMKQMKSADFMKGIRERLKAYIDSIEKEKSTLKKELLKLQQDFD